MFPSSITDYLTATLETRIDELCVCSICRVFIWPDRWRWFHCLPDVMTNGRVGRSADITAAAWRGGAETNQSVPLTHLLLEAPTTAGQHASIQALVQKPWKNDVGGMSSPALQTFLTPYYLEHCLRTRLNAVCTPGTSNYIIYNWFIHVVMTPFTDFNLYVWVNLDDGKSAAHFFD